MWPELSAQGAPALRVDWPLRAQHPAIGTTPQVPSASPLHKPVPFVWHGHFTTTLCCQGSTANCTPPNHRFHKRNTAHDGSDGGSTAALPQGVRVGAVLTPEMLAELTRLLAESR